MLQIFKTVIHCNLKFLIFIIILKLMKYNQNITFKYFNIVYSIFILYQVFL